MPITIKNASEINRMRDAGHVVALVHRRIEEAVRPGVTTGDLDAVARDTLNELGARSSFLGYPGPYPFPGNICASVNDEIVHGIPGRRVLREGDIISVDVGAIVDGYHGDSAWTYPVGRVSDDAARLLRDTESALDVAIAAALSGNRLGAVGYAVQRFGDEYGYGVQDMKFENTTDAPILIREWVDDKGFLNAQILGQPTGKKVEMATEKIFEDTTRGIRWDTYKKVTEDGEVTFDGRLHTYTYSYNPPPPDDGPHYDTSAPRVSGWNDPGNTTGWAEVPE